MRPATCRRIEILPETVEVEVLAHPVLFNAHNTLPFAHLTSLYKKYVISSFFCLAAESAIPCRPDLLAGTLCWSYRASPKAQLKDPGL